jgi:hypothetical protein
MALLPVTGWLRYAPHEKSKLTQPQLLIAGLRFPYSSLVHFVTSGAHFSFSRRGPVQSGEAAPHSVAEKGLSNG